MGPAPSAHGPAAWAIVAIDRATGYQETLATFPAHEQALAHWLDLVTNPRPPEATLRLIPRGQLPVQALSQTAWEATVRDQVQA